MQIAADEKRRPMLEPMLPLINVVFLLLVFFMVAGHMAQQPPVDVKTPESEARHQPLEDMPRLALRPGGKLLLDGETLARERLAAEGRQLLTSERPRLHADARVSSKELRPVLQALRDAGFESVQLITLRSES